MNIVFKWFFAIVFLAYPLLVYFGLTFFDWRGLSLAVLVLAIARVAGIFAAGGPAPLRNHMIAAACALVLVAAGSLMFKDPQALRVYPVLVNVLLLAVFSISLFRPPSIIERFARLSDPDLPPEGQRYTRKVTAVWCGFFLLNGSISLYTVLIDDLAVWTVYNGGISYLLMGGLFGVEYLVRLRVRRRQGLS